ncbi:hypothetical protein [Saccharothrix variisporea]|uniref:Mannosyltransferase PIG-V n=1 Tax=Saccharothrix variisporea TaxID=543527 RepID=A0A495X8A5_9PSEU|nr:hypothetical protein [Saccharothrix variisporea]RKT70242.1 hypothetical protein DFJ66_3498 [Saccharothrix variisporea]
MVVLAERLRGIVPEHRPVRRPWTFYLAGFVAAVAFQLVTPAGRSHLDHVWAEDGARFLLDGVKEPFLTNLITPYGGYLHVVPRLSAELVSLLPLTWAAVGFALAAAVPRALVALITFAASAGYLRSTALRVGLAALVVVLPVGNSEPLGNVTNLHWFLLYGLFWVLLWRDAPRVPALLFVALATLSSPLAFLLAPLALLRYLTHRDRVLPATFALAAAVQGTVMVFAERTPYSHDPVDPVQVLLATLLRVPVAGFTGSEQVADLYPRFGNAPTAIALVLIAVPVTAALVWRDRPARFLTVTAAAYSAVTITSSLVANWTVALQVQQPGVVTTSQRYSVLPCLLLFTAVAVGLDATPTRGRRLVITTRAVIALTLLAGVVQHTRDQSGVLTGTSWTDSVTAAEAQCSAGTRPVGRFVHEPTGWFFELPCELVTRG